MKKVAIISCNDNYDYDTRTKYVSKFLEKKGYEVTFVIADFDHRNKKKYIAYHQHKFKYIEVPSYNKNLSIKRVISHLIFANKVASYIYNNNFDLIYHCAPPNSTIKTISKVKKHKKFILITEIGDMWPETMPISNIIKQILKFPFSIWSDFRDKYLFNSDIVISECDLFTNKIIENTKIDNVHTMYFCKEPNYVSDFDIDVFKDELNLCYLGSINNIIDLDIIQKLIFYLAKSKVVNVYIIGDGEKRDELLKTISSSGGNPFYCGKIFDEIKKKEIFSSCHYGLNIMKKDVFVGMTMKSLDYFSYGLPIINNIGADIGKMITDNKIGFNISDSTIEMVSEQILKTNVNEYKRMRLETQCLHEKYFSIDSFYKKMESFKIEEL